MFDKGSCSHDGCPAYPLSSEEARTTITGNEEVDLGSIGKIEEVGIVGVVAGVFCRNLPGKLRLTMMFRTSPNTLGGIRLAIFG